MKEVILDGRLLTTKNRLYDAFEEAFHLPDHFGRNLDALWDVLNEETEPTVIHFTHVHKYLEEMDGYSEQVIRMFTTLDQLNDQYEVKFYPFERDQ